MIGSARIGTQARQGTLKTLLTTTVPQQGFYSMPRHHPPNEARHGQIIVSTGELSFDPLVAHVALVTRRDCTRTATTWTVRTLVAHVAAAREQEIVIVLMRHRDMGFDARLADVAQAWQTARHG